jgi:PAS domain S-box-containing protein
MVSKKSLCQEAVADRGTFVALGFQKSRNNFANGFFVVDDQYLCFGQIPPQTTSLYGRAQIHDCILVQVRARMLTWPAVSSQRIASLVTVPSLRFAALRRFQRSMPNQGLLAITFFESISFILLLVLYFLLDRDRPARFFRFWIAGWVALTVFSVLRILSILLASDMVRLIAVECYLAGIALFFAAVWEYTGRAIRPVVFYPLMAVQGAALIFVERHPLNGLSGTHLPTGILQCVLLLGAGWLLWRYSRHRSGYGGKLLAATMLLAGLHVMDVVSWPSQYIYLLRIALQDFLNVALGAAVAVLVLEETRMRLEDLSDKLRRLTLITAASTQSLNVDQMLGVVLHHLVESLNATHGLIRLVAGSGDGAELIIRSAIGYSDAYLMKYERIPVQLPWVRKIVEQDQVYSVLDELNGMDHPAWSPQDNLSSALLVRLPGPHTALGWILVGSKGKRKFYREEITFLLNVANLLGLTVQSLRLFEQVATVQRQWVNTFNSIDDPILVHDPEGKIIRVNQAFENRAGVATGNMEGKAISDVLRRGAVPWDRCPYCEGAAGKGGDVDAGLGGFILASTSQFHDADGRPLGIIHVLQDITERRRAEQRYQILIENVREGVFMASPDNRFLDFNQAFMGMLGYEDREELMRLENIGASLYVNPRDRDRLMKMLHDFGSVSNFEFQIRRKDGGIRTVLESSFVTRDASGRISAYQGFVLDITERKQSEQEIRRRNRELLVLNAIGQTLNQPFELDEMLDRALRQLVELFGEDQGAVYLLDRDTHEMSRAAAFGMRSEYAHYFPPAPFPADLLEHICAVRARVLSQPGLLLPLVFRDAQRAEGIVTSQILVLWSRTQPIGLLSLGHRTPKEFAPAELNLLTTVGSQIAVAVEKAQLYEETRAAYENLRRAQEQLLQSEKMAAVGQLISGVAHELNNPLTAILGYGQLLASTDVASAQGADYVEKLYKQAQRTHRIVQNLLSFARQRKPERLPVQLNQILEDTIALREYDLQANNIKVHRQFAENLPEISADAHQLQQVFLNILNNAVDAVLGMQIAGELWVRTTQDTDANRLVVEFIDNGPGVKEIPKVFDPFYTTKPVGKGTGLGLSICYGIVTEHGGDILVRNVPPRGACFTILLPRSAVADYRLQEHAEAGELGGPGRILLVDEEDAVRDLEREILRPHFRTLYTVRNLREAKLLLESEPFDLVVAEWKTKGDFAGHEFYDWICRAQPELANRLIFTISGTNTEENVSIEMRTVCLFLRKPFRIDQLLTMVRRALGPRDISVPRR